ncbi:MAG: hybrid sensor histidine kinase/response regulator, partial [Bacteroidetes bacterium]
TYGAGLVRFDGNYFSHYTTENGLTDNFILNLIVDSQGRLIFGTRTGGMVIFDGEMFLVFDKNNGFPNNRIESIFEDSQGNLWIGTFGAGVLKYNGIDFLQFDTSCGLAGNVIYAVTEDEQGNIWMGTRGNGISTFDGNVFTHYTTANGLSSDFITSLNFDKNGDLWIGTDGGGISVFTGDTFMNYSQEYGFPDNEITVAYTGSDNELWIGTRRSGLIKYDGTHFTQFTEKDGLVNNFITSINEDYTGKLWVGTYGGGVGSFHGNVFRHYSEREGIPEPFIRALLEDSKGNLWLGMNSLGVLKLGKDSDTLHWYTQNQGMEDNRLRTLFEDKRGNIWMGFLNHGLSVFDGENFSTFDNDKLLSDIAVVSMLEQDSGVLWIASYGDGLFKLDNDTVIQYTSENGLSNDYLRKILEDEHGNLWIATRDGGINYFDGESFTQFTRNEGMPTNDIFDIHIDRLGTLWIGTNGAGLLMYKNGELTTFTEQHGLGSNFIYSVLEGHDGNMWFGTRWGLSLFLGRSIHIGETESYQHISNAHARGIFFKTFTRDDGFMGIGVNSRAMLQAQDQTIWIGANDLLTAFYPENIVLDTKAPYIYLSWVGLFNEKIPWSELIHKQDSVVSLSNGVRVDNYSYDSVTSWYGIPENLKLAHDNNYIVFSFSGITSSITGLLRYQHKLDGLEENWSLLSQNTEAHYGNLKPGSYTFRLRAMNKEGYSSDELEFSFVIAPPWWLTWWAYLVYAFLFILLATGSYFYLRDLKIKKGKKKQEELELQQQVAVAQKSVEFKQNFLANMSHEIRTPLTGVLGMADLLFKTPLNETQADYLKTLIHSGENLREIINLVLDYSKIEAGKVKLQEEIFSIDKLLADAEKLFISICRKDIVLIKDVDSYLPVFVKSDYNRIFQIISNLLSNAVKFTEKGSIRIKVSAETSEESYKDMKKIRIAVSDTGKGISNADQTNLFKPFYQAEQSYNRAFEGTGLGLAICKELSEILGGSIGYERNKFKGSTFWFTFLAKMEKEPEAASRENIPVKKSSNESLRILLVEDKAVNQKVITLILESMNHQVSLADDGKKAIEMFKTGSFDLILMDIQMPVMDGITATQNLKSRFSKLPPIVGLSANAFEGDREKYMRLGMDEYLTKPVKESDFENLLQKLNL